MSEAKKGRGRPKKESPSIENEEVSKITMSDKRNQDKQIKRKVSNRVVKEQVGQVSSSSSSVPDTVTLDALQNRWREAFRKYGNNLEFGTIFKAWNDNVNFLNNPFLQNQRIKQINSPVRSLSREQLKAALADPEHNEDILRSVSMMLYYTNYIYYFLIQMNRNTPMYNYYATPLYVQAEDKKSIKDDYVRVDKLLKRFNPQLTFKTIATQVYLEGKSSYLVRTSYDKKDVDFFVLQKLNSDMVKITGFGSKQQFVASFNMIIFLQPEYNINQYPKFIRDTWSTMINNGVIVEDEKGNKKFNPKAELPPGHILEGLGNGSYMYWVQLPQDLCYTFYSDGAHPNAFPETLGLFEDFDSLTDYRWLQGNLLSKGVTSLLTAEVPLV